MYEPQPTPACTKCDPSWGAAASAARRQAGPAERQPAGPGKKKSEKLGNEAVADEKASQTDRRHAEPQWLPLELGLELEPTQL